MTMNRRNILKMAGLAPLFGLPGQAAGTEAMVFRHAITLFESVKYPEGFSRFDYANPAAPKGGTFRIGALGTFDSLNPYTIKGDPVGFPTLFGAVETLLTNALDEPSSEYGLLASGVWHPEDFSRAVFRLRPEARFHDGRPVSPQDVIWSLDAIKANLVTRAAYYKDIAKAEQTGEHEVTFFFSASGNRELPLVTGQLPVLPKHWWTAADASGKPRDISASTLEIPLGSGPYRITKAASGATIRLERAADYWGKDLPVNAGHHNFDVIEYTFYRDQTVMFEAFKGDQFDVHVESVAKQWATGYDFPAIKDGRCIKEEVPQERVHGMQAFVPNLRRAMFRDRRVRRALNLAFDFEWSNANLFYGQYFRSRSYFNNSELEAKGLPSPEELAVLEPLRDKLPPEVFTSEFANPTNATAQDRRKNLREAQRLLTEAGWSITQAGGKSILRNAGGQVFTFEILLYSPVFERIALPYKEQLALLGIDAQVRTVDLAQYERVTENFDYDMIIGSWGQSLSPGNEQRFFWGSEAADKPGSENYIGVKDAAIDILVDKVIFAKSRKELITATRALDRVLQWNEFVVPHWFAPHARLAYWNRFGHPEPLPGFGLGYPDIWWWDAAKAEKIKKT